MAYLASGLFRFPTAQTVQNQLTFLSASSNQTAGVIVIKLIGRAAHENVLVVFNAANAVYTLKNASMTMLKLDLYLALKTSSDAVVRLGKASGDSVSWPALTTAVFVGK